MPAAVNHRGRAALTAAVSVLTVTLVACSAPAQTTQESREPTSDPVPTATASAASVSAGPSTAVAAVAPVSGAGMAEHVHNLAYDGDRLMMGTHEGLWAQAPGEEPEQVSRESFDVMGFTAASERWLASGHPGPGMDAPADLGLLQSTDRGRTWDEVSLGGDADFHRLVASGAAVVGVNAHDGRVLRSDDGGQTWADLGTPGLYDVVMDPADPSVLVGTTPDGPVRSTDGGATFGAVQDAPLLALLAWTDTALYGIDVDGAVHASSDGGATWEGRGAVSQQPAALAADGDRVAALVGDQVVESSDGGREFGPRIVDIPGH